MHCVLYQVFIANKKISEIMYQLKEKVLGGWSSSIECTFLVGAIFRFWDLTWGWCRHHQCREVLVSNGLAFESSELPGGLSPSELSEIILIKSLIVTSPSPLYLTSGSTMSKICIEGGLPSQCVEMWSYSLTNSFFSEIFDIVILFSYFVRSNRISNSFYIVS